MSYPINRIVDDATVDGIEARTRRALAEIDVKATMKKKIDKDMPGYLILGACNSNMAWQAIGMEPKVGAMLPCNVIRREIEKWVEVSAIDSQASMTAIDNAGFWLVGNGRVEHYCSFGYCAWLGADGWEFAPDDGVEGDEVRRGWRDG